MTPNSEQPEPPYTAWHIFFVRFVEYLLDPAKLEVRPFDKLGSLPLEADIILLRKVADLAGVAQLPDLDFLLPYLGLYTILEYKSPDDRITVASFDTVRAYAMLCKRKYGIALDEQVRVVLLYSHAAEDFFPTCHRNGHRFVEIEPGIRACDTHPLQVFAMDLVALGRRFPQSLINLFSARHRQFSPAATAEDPARMALLDYLYYSILQKELKKMLSRQEELKGLREMSTDMQRVLRQLMQHLPVEERLLGLSAEDLLKGISPEELERLRQLLDRQR